MKPRNWIYCVKVYKQKKCKVRTCRKPFTPWTTLQKVCNTQCAIDLLEQNEKDNYKKETTRLTKQYYSTDKKHWKKKAKDSCHRFIRTRDVLLPCMYCGTFHAGQWDACHYKSRKARPELQFHSWNINRGHNQCNRYEPISKYRANLIIKIGLVNVEYLELDHKHYIWTLDDYKDIYQWYRDRYVAL